MPSNYMYMCVHVSMYIVHCTMCHIQCTELCVIYNVCSLLFMKVVDFAEIGKQTVLQSFEGFWCGRIVHCCCIVL